MASHGGKKDHGLYLGDVEGKRLSLGRATGRTFAKYLPASTAGIGYVMCGFTKRKQALHDMPNVWGFAVLVS